MAEKSIFKILDEKKKEAENREKSEKLIERMKMRRRKQVLENRRMNARAKALAEKHERTERPAVRESALARKLRLMNAPRFVMEAYRNKDFSLVTSYLARHRVTESGDRSERSAIRNSSLVERVSRRDRIEARRAAILEARRNRVGGRPRRNSFLEGLSPRERKMTLGEWLEFKKGQKAIAERIKARKATSKMDEDLNPTERIKLGRLLRESKAPEFIRRAFVNKDYDRVARYLENRRRRG
jgi:hypothetical protein